MESEFTVETGVAASDATVGSDGSRIDLPGLNVSVELVIDPTVNFAMQQNDVPVVRFLRLTNAGDTSLEEIQLRIHGEPEFALPFERRLARLAEHESLELKTVPFELSPGYLGHLTERVAGRLHLELSQDGGTPFRQSWPIEVLARDEWSGLRSLPEILAAFVQPNHPAVEKVLVGASDILAGWSGDGSLNGFQSRSRERVLATTAAIYAALAGQGIRYITPPASFETAGQKIRLPERILDNGFGTCLDLAVLAAACLEQAGLHPLVVLVEGHAFAGVWLDDDCFPDCATDDLLRLRKRVDLGAICVFEATALTSRPPADFDTAVSLAKRHLLDPTKFQCALDIFRSRKSSIRPLPTLADQVRAEADRAPAEAAATQPAPFAPPITAIPNVVPDGVPESPAETPVTRLDRWKRKLLDLSLNNRLLNFRQTAKTIRVLCPDLGSLEDALADGRQFKVKPRPADFDQGTPRNLDLLQERSGQNALETLLHEEFASRRLRADLPTAELDRRMLEVYRSARASMEESGASTLYLALGMLEWFESPQSTQPRRAPLILLPLEIDRRSVLDGFRIRQRDEEPRINTTLLAMLGKDFELNIAGLDPLPQDKHGIDLSGILNIFRQAILHMDRWDVREEAWIGLFSFTKFLMWRDLEVRTEDLMQNTVVSHLINRPEAPFPVDGAFPQSDRLDQTYQPSKTFCPLDADSSQLAAVYAAAEGKSFVLEGPPGTGKSQTITNLIAHCLATGKTVLFVAEKMAALSVVHARLKRCGLEAFCLELHSNKGDKKKVIEQLAAALDARETQSGQDWQRESERLATARTTLNAYAEALHKKQDSGETIFQGLSRLIGLRHVRRLNMSWPSAATMTHDTLEAMRECVDRMTTVARVFPSPGASPWSVCGLNDYSLGNERAIVAALDQVESTLAALQTRVEVVAPLLGFPGKPSHNELRTMQAAAGFLLGAPEMPGTILTAAPWPAAREEISGWLEQGRTRDNLRSSLSERYAEAFFGLDPQAMSARLAEAEKSWALPRWFKRRSLRKAIQAVCRDGIAAELGLLEADLSRLATFKDARNVIRDCTEKAARLFGPVWNDGQPDWDALEGLLRWVSSFHETTVTCAGDPAKAPGLGRCWSDLLAEPNHAERKERLQDYNKAWVEFSAALDGLGTQLMVKADAAYGPDADPSWLEGVGARLQAWRDGLGQLQLWCRWQSIRTEALGLSLAPLVAAFEAGSLEQEALPLVFERSYVQWWVESLIDMEPALRGFFSPEFERMIEQFKDLDKHFMALSRSEIQTRLARNVPSPGASRVCADSELGVLLRQKQLKRRHMPVRLLFGRIPNLLPRLKPCLLMSPISVAQYLDAGHPPFDLVIFDEASQMPVWDAVGAIARGRSAVVVGDPKQLPPTSFFNRTDDESMSDDEPFEEMESILDECLAAQLPHMQLRWHYRSRHEGLIAFSNYHYYDNRLLTFPAPSRALGVSLRRVSEGCYDKGKSRTNRAEAEAVVAEIVRRLKSPRTSAYSIGVVTFSVSQQTLVEDLLEAARREDPDIEPFFGSDATEPVFVKNLENVQGDERDLILFSICYGPDAAGKVSMNFGPLNKDGGERRLNVAITRARQEIVVFSTVTAEHIDLARTRATGVGDLKRFLDYAEHGYGALGADLTTAGDDFDSPFEAQVCAELRKLGHDVHSQVGCSGYRIDLAVVDPERPGRYLLGIECDGANYHRAKTARDRDRLREAVLRNLGWELFRIWSTDWWKNPEPVLKKLEGAIEKAREAREKEAEKAAKEPIRIPEPPEVPPAVTGPAEPPAPPSPAYPIYEAHSVERQRGPQEAFYLPEAEFDILWLVESIVGYESPMSLTLLARRVSAHWGFGKVTAKCQRRVADLLGKTKVRTIRHGDRTFIWQGSKDPASFDIFRVPGPTPESQREAADLPPEEIANAARHVLAGQVSMPLDDLVRETARVFGFQRCGTQVDKYIRYGMRRLLLEDSVKQENGMVTMKG